MALSHFIKFGGIPLQAQLDLLNAIISEKWTMLMFMKQCQLFKAKARVRDYILEVFGLDDTEVLTKEYPVCADRMRDMITQWGSVVMQLAVRAPLPAGLVMATKKLYQVALDAKNHKNLVTDNQQVGFLQSPAFYSCFSCLLAFSVFDL